MTISNVGVAAHGDPQKRREFQMKKLKTQNGITLIALVITIIVMLILVAVTISMAINGGLFEKAGKATGDTKNAMNAEQTLAKGGIIIGDTRYNSIEDYLYAPKLKYEIQGAYIKIWLENSYYDSALKRHDRRRSGKNFV